MKRKQQEIDPNTLITVTPANHPSLSEGATIVKVIALEAVGGITTHALHWPWWIGAQLPVIYLFWRLMHERDFYTRIVIAWNKRLTPEQQRPKAMTIEEANRFIERMDKASDDKP